MGTGFGYYWVPHTSALLRAESVRCDQLIQKGMRALVDKVTTPEDLVDQGEGLPDSSTGRFGAMMFE
jgi:hypothetical protein